MKKYFILILMMCIFICNSVSAAEIKNVRCDYTLTAAGSKITNVSVYLYDYGGNTTIGKTYTDYNGNTKTYSSATVSDFYDSGGDRGYYLSILKDEDDEFYSAFKASTSCPTINLIVDNNSSQIRFTFSEPSSTDDSSSASLYSELFQRDGDSKWYSKTKFLELDSEEESGGTSTTTAKEDKVCTFNISFDRVSTSLPSSLTVVFTTKYDAFNNNKESYYINIAGIEDQISSPSDGYTRYVDSETITISGTDLSKVYNSSTCPTTFYTYKNAENDNLTLTLDKTNIKDNSTTGMYQTTTEETEKSKSSSGLDIDISTEDMNCSKILGPNLLKILKLCVTALRIAGAIIVLVKASLALIPPIQSGDEGAIKKAAKECVTLAIILLVIGVFPTLIKVLAMICGFDPSCLEGIL